MNIFRIILCLANVALVLLYLKGVIYTNLRNSDLLLISIGLAILRFPAPIFAVLVLCLKPVKWIREAAIGFNALQFLIFNAGLLIAAFGHSAANGRPFVFRYDLLLYAVNLLFFWAQRKFQGERIHTDTATSLPVKNERPGNLVSGLSKTGIIAPALGTFVAISLMTNSGPGHIGVGFVVLGVILVTPVLGLVLSLLAVALAKTPSLLAKMALWLNLSYLSIGLAIQLRWFLFSIR